MAEEGETVHRDFRGRTRRRPARPHEWTEAKQALFVAELREHGCTRTAAAAAGMTERSAHDRRSRDADFDEACRAATAAHYDELELRLLRKARGETGPELDGLNAELALHLLKQHRPDAGAKRQGRRPRAATKAELIEALTEKLRAVKQRQGAPRND